MLSSCLTFVLVSLLQDNIRSCLDVEDDEIQSLMEMIFNSCFPESQVRSPCNLASTDRSPHPPIHPHSSDLLLLFVTIFPSFDSSKNEGVNAFKLMVLAPESLKTDPFEHGLLQRFLKYPTRDRLKFHKDTVLRLLSALSFQGTHSCDSPQTPTSSLSIHQNTSTPPKMSMHFHGVSSSETPVVDESVGFKILHN